MGKGAEAGLLGLLLKVVIVHGTWHQSALSWFQISSSQEEKFA